PDDDAAVLLQGRVGHRGGGDVDDAAVQPGGHRGGGAGLESAVDRRPVFGQQQVVVDVDGDLGDVPLVFLLQLDVVEVAVSPDVQRAVRGQGEGKLIAGLQLHDVQVIARLHRVL